MKIIMLGAPGAGKGTQAKMIAEKYAVPHISTGDIFRANIKNQTELGMEAKKYMDEGKLVPDELTVRILLDRVAKEDCKNGYVLDGFPRTIPQAEVLNDALTKAGDKIDYAIDVNVPDENIVRRMSGRRACVNCGATYHIVHIPPKQENICDKCGSELFQRPDEFFLFRFRKLRRRGYLGGDPVFGFLYHGLEFPDDLLQVFDPSFTDKYMQKTHEGLGNIRAKNTNDQSGLFVRRDLGGS